MKRLHAPWRSKYIASFSKADKTCVFCTAVKEKKDGQNYIIARAGTCFVIMNLFPYNSGHLMVVPYRHLSSIEDLKSKEMVEIMELIQKMIKCLKNTSRPDGFNIGANLGRTAGAGIDGHIHFHIVPRWSGDTNFMPILSDTKMISEDMSVSYKKLKNCYKKIKR